ncbi:family 43 glycosylhydrolase [Parabacteroides sp. FAFU027]|uniref:family 43 glycosylhydrolase n=1 Tax=Parabacteroides sp. FAFU027 TaxID=2922715 RepID=UPI001FAF0EE3|nr:family 43 glycosylhydrolase [Parabacteroides sp. FAFU027]
MKRHIVITILLIIIPVLAFSQNPVIRNQYSADPTARVFNGKVYLFPSHDILTPQGKGLRPDWFCMADYHVFSSDNLTDWTDHGVIVSQEKVKWVDSTSYSMWAPDCVERNGKYYFYFPANTNLVGANGRKGFGIGVAIAEKPEGPYLPQDEPIKGVPGIDPNVFIDKDGQAYLIWAMGKISIAKLKENMLELASEPQEIKDLPTKGLKEGPFMFERNGIYYMTYPHVENTIERLEYATADNPMGPFKFAGVIMDESPTNCWTNHQSIVNFKDQWYLFYHQNDWSPKFDKNRSVRIDSLNFNADGTIRKVKPTLRGVGLTKASDEIQLDRYNLISDKGASIAYNDTLDYFKGWKTVLTAKDAWIQYNSVAFDKESYKWLDIKYISPKGGVLTICQDSKKAGMVSTIKVPASAEWKTMRVKISGMKKGIHSLILSNAGNNPVEIDWIKF